MALTQGAVVREALALLDEQGLDKLSFRRLAERLGVRAPTLYWYVRDKRELLDLIVVEMFGEAFVAHRAPAVDQSWEAWLDQRARALRAALLAHRDSARVLAGNRPPPSALVQIEGAIEGLVAVGFSSPDALLALLVISTFVMGDVLEHQGEAARGETGKQRKPADSSAFPMLADARPAIVNRSDQGFEFGLRLLIDGLRVRLGQVAEQR